MKRFKKLLGNFITTLIIMLCFGMLIVKSQTALHKALDYDGNGRTDLSVLRPKENIWYILRNGGGGLLATSLGTSTLDTPTPGDFDGDGKGDIAVWRERDGNFYYIQSSNGAFISKHFGKPGISLSPEITTETVKLILLFETALTLLFMLNKAVMDKYKPTTGELRVIYRLLVLIPINIEFQSQQIVLNYQDEKDTQHKSGCLLLSIPNLGRPIAADFSDENRRVILV